MNEEKMTLEKLAEMVARGFETASTEISELRAEMNVEIAGLRTEMHTEIAGLRTEMHAEFATLRTDDIDPMKKDIAAIKEDVSKDTDDLRAPHRVRRPASRRRAEARHSYPSGVDVSRSIHLSPASKTRCWVLRWGRGVSDVRQCATGRGPKPFRFAPLQGASCLTGQ
jgi:ribosomal protein L29